MSFYWLFTSFNVHNAPEVMLKNQFVYLVYQLEKAPDTGRYHYQGYVAFHCKKKLATLKNTAPEWHWDARRGTHMDAKAYCTKDASRIEGPFEYGTDAEIPTKKGDRSDLKRLADALQEDPDTDLTEDFGAELIKFPGGINAYKNELKNKKNKLELAENFSLFKPTPWQSVALKKLEKQNDRQILWVVDETGGRGKTYLAKWMIATQSAFYVQSGKKEDITFAYGNEKVVIFDYTRADKEYVNYGIIESFKNGLVWSPKYQSTLKIMNIPKIIVFSNWEPDRTKLSSDRWQVMDLDSYPSGFEVTDLYCEEETQAEPEGPIEIPQSPEYNE